MLKLSHFSILNFRETIFISAFVIHEPPLQNSVQRPAAATIPVSGVSDALQIEYGADFIPDIFQILFEPPPLSSCPSAHQTPSFHSLVCNAINTPRLRYGVGCSARRNEMCGISVIYVKETRKAVLVLPTKQAQVQKFFVLCIGGWSCFYQHIRANKTLLSLFSRRKQVESAEALGCSQNYFCAKL